MLSFYIFIVFLLFLYLTIHILYIVYMISNIINIIPLPIGFMRDNKKKNYRRKPELKRNERDIYIILLLKL